MSKQEMIREALEVVGKTASNSAIRSYVKRTHGIEVQSNEIWAAAGREKDRNFNDVSYEELKNVTKDAKRYGSVKRLITVAQAAEMKATRA